MGEIFVQAIPPTQKSGGGGCIPPPSPPPGIYASAMFIYSTALQELLDAILLDNAI